MAYVYTCYVYVSRSLLTHVTEIESSKNDGRSENRVETPSEICIRFPLFDSVTYYNQCIPVETEINTLLIRSVTMLGYTQGKHHDIIFSCSFLFIRTFTEETSLSKIHPSSLVPNLLSQLPLPEGQRGPVDTVINNNPFILIPTDI